MPLTPSRNLPVVTSMKHERVAKSASRVQNDLFERFSRNCGIFHAAHLWSFRLTMRLCYSKRSIMTCLFDCSSCVISSFVADSCFHCHKGCRMSFECAIFFVSNNFYADTLLSTSCSCFGFWLSFGGAKSHVGFS